MRRTYSDREEELGFKLGRRRSSRHPATVITDFADDIALITEKFEQAQLLLERLENEAEQIGLYCNSKKTEAQPFNQTNIGVIKAKNGETIKLVNSFKYLGAWSESSEKDISIRKALDRSSCHRLRKIWNSSLSKHLKLRIFTTTVESILLY